MWVVIAIIVYEIIGILICHYLYDIDWGWILPLAAIIWPIALAISFIVFMDWIKG